MRRALCRHCSFLLRTKSSIHFARLYASDSVQGLDQAIIARARRLADQYNQLSKEAATDTDFTPETAQRQKRLSELEQVNAAWTAWRASQDNLKELQGLMQSTDDAEMKALAAEDLEITRQELQSCSDELEKSIMPKHPQAHLPALLEIRAGVGGDEANLFAGDLLRMYEKYAASKRWTIQLYSISRTEIGDGITEAVLSISAGKRQGEVFGRLQGEAGVHRVQRTPATETKGRTHTSTVSVHVLPEVDDDAEQAFKLDMSEVKLEVMRSRGAGGQHVNRTESAVRLTHIPTGLSISMQDSRSQHANKRAAITILTSKLAALRQDEADAVQVGLRRQQVSSSDRSEKIRTYNFAQNRVTDHRCGYSSHDLEGVLAGGEALDGMLDEAGKWIAKQALQASEET
ncbi:putative peptide chain release factor 1, mitochondrial [Protomyces lactucae-debilis]|uniref:Putative peptide chain release factor 1, mitochondrial n=1 Tax=Protomyces lactucae-debilis TaxID=2754530 RepID=A0A1Y2EU42_PROLT|nr:putative peptide chain release factor 1, mitochondrial [Protomyces lactucae-debilis]ORY75078.1 putative peptide chain release factor 1, mitochondrial [Protomyces lactucae-debilis]